MSNTDLLSTEQSTISKDCSTDQLTENNENINNSNVTNQKITENGDQNDEKKPEALLITMGPSKVSLQDRFKQFKKQRHDKFKYQQYLKNKKVADRSTKEFQDYLRNKFVETAKKYLGVPYAKRYLKPDDPKYNSPIFLDCCGLVRQVVYDLREDFGFTLARWNQAYQFDTLPIDLKFEELRPGDLIFYSGTYYEPKKHRPQKHDMVHVEIFLGGPTGEQTIGSRWNNGVVSIFDSYKFVSKSYYDIKFYYKSIDTWLQGVCKSFCETHPWTDDRDLWTPDKFSVFAEVLEDEDSIGNGPEEEEKAETSPSESESRKKQRAVFIGNGNNDKLIRNYFANEYGI